MELMQAIYERCSVREFADKTPGTYPGCERPNDLCRPPCANGVREHPPFSDGKRIARP
jgi:hypothetical protein